MWCLLLATLGIASAGAELPGGSIGAGLAQGEDMVPGMSMTMDQFNQMAQGYNTGKATLDVPGAGNSPGSGSPFGFMPQMMLPQSMNQMSPKLPGMLPFMMNEIVVNMPAVVGWDLQKKRQEVASKISRKGKMLNSAQFVSNMPRLEQVPDMSKLPQFQPRPQVNMQVQQVGMPPSLGAPPTVSMPPNMDMPFPMSPLPNGGQYGPFSSAIMGLAGLEHLPQEVYGRLQANMDSSKPTAQPTVHTMMGQMMRGGQAGEPALTGPMNAVMGQVMGQMMGHAGRPSPPDVSASAPSVEAPEVMEKAAEKKEEAAEALIASDVQKVEGASAKGEGAPAATEARKKDEANKGDSSLLQTGTGAQAQVSMGMRLATGTHQLFAPQMMHYWKLPFDHGLVPQKYAPLKEAPHLMELITGYYANDPQTMRLVDMANRGEISSYYAGFGSNTVEVAEQLDRNQKAFSHGAKSTLSGGLRTQKPGAAALATRPGFVPAATPTTPAFGFANSVPTFNSFL